MKAATESSLLSPVNENSPRGSLAARRPVARRRRSKPVRTLCEPRFQARTSDAWKVVSNWYQLVPLVARELKLLTLTLGSPGLAYFVSPSNPGIPSAVPAPG